MDSECYLNIHCLGSVMIDSLVWKTFLQVQEKENNQEETPENENGIRASCEIKNPTNTEFVDHMIPSTLV